MTTPTQGILSAVGRGTRVDLLTPLFLPEVRRGTERTVADLAGGLRARGMRPRVVTGARRPGSSEGVLRVPRLDDRYATRVLPDEHMTHLPFAFAAVQLGGAALAHAFHAGDAWIASHCGIPAIHTHMGLPDASDLAAHSGRVRIVRAALRRCFATVVLSHHAADRMEATFGVRPRVIHPGVDLRRFSVGAERSESPTVVCHAFGAEPRKRIGLLLEAWPLVRRSFPAARLLLDRRGLTARLPTGVEVVDFDDDRRLADTLAVAWAVALPSTHEAFGLVLVEALATGTPVVASAGWAFGEIVDRPAVGTLFEGGAPELAAALCEVFELACDPGTRSACRARAEEFSLERMIDAHLALYAEALAA